MFGDTCALPYYPPRPLLGTRHKANTSSVFPPVFVRRRIAIKTSTRCVTVAKLACGLLAGECLLIAKDRFSGVTASRMAGQ